jgi:hypothetical protein
MVVGEQGVALNATPLLRWLLEKRDGWWMPSDAMS